MKKLFFYASCTALLMSSCSNEIESISEMPKSGDEIIVTTYNAGMTRADEIGLQTLQDNGFSLYAKNNQTDTTLFFKDFTYSNGREEGTTEGWSTDEKLYWPANDAVTFTGFSSDPELTRTETAEDGSVVWSFTNTDATNDVMVATLTAQRDNTNAGEINLQFDHLMAKVSIDVKGLTFPMTYNISSAYLTFPTGGIYTVADGFEANETTTSYALVEEDMVIAEEAAETLTEEALLVTPGTATISFTYKACYDAENTMSVEGEVTKAAEITIESGKVYTIHAELSASNEVEIKVTAEVNNWGDEEEKTPVLSKIE